MLTLFEPEPHQVGNTARRWARECAVYLQCGYTKWRNPVDIAGVREKKERDFMIFVGGGALLVEAISYCKRAGLTVDLVCCRQTDPSISILKKNGVSVLETNDVNTDLLPLLNVCTDSIAFSINNYVLLQDKLLSAGVSFFNIHNGLVQRYRGTAEVCVFAGLCNGEEHYGVTLHRVLPGQQVDSGPVISQLRFEIGDEVGFSDVMDRSLDACRKMFELNVGSILHSSYSAVTVKTAGKAYSYKDVPRLCLSTTPERLAKAVKLGRYAYFFPKLASTIESASK